MNALLSTALAVVIHTWSFGIGTEILPEAKFIFAGSDLTAINNTDGALNFTVTNTTTSQVIHSAVVAAFSQGSYTVNETVGHTVRSVLKDNQVPPQVREDVSHVVLGKK